MNKRGNAYCGMNDSTKDQLLIAAVNVFASKPFHDAKISEICEQAGANGAAVNYYFKSKAALLNEALMCAFRIADERYPLDGGLSPYAPPEERLRTFMEAIILRSFDPGPAGHFERIMGQELGARAGQDRATAAKFRKIHDEVLDPIVTELIHPRTEEELVQARIAIISLCIFQNTVPELPQILFPDGRSEAALHAYVERRFTFGLAGLKAMAEEARSKPPTLSPVRPDS